MASAMVEELRAAGRWPELWAAVMASGGIEAVHQLAATMTEAEVEADVRARQAQAAALCGPTTGRSRIAAQRAVLDHAETRLSHDRA